MVFRQDSTRIPFGFHARRPRGIRSDSTRGVREDSERIPRAVLRADSVRIPRRFHATPRARARPIPSHPIPSKAVELAEIFVLETISAGASRFSDLWKTGEKPNGFSTEA